MHNITFLLFPGFALTSYSLAIDALLVANRITGEKLYRIALASAAQNGDLLVASSGKAPVQTDSHFCSTGQSSDTVFICAYQNAASYNYKPVLTKLKQFKRKQKRLGCLTSGSFILAKADIIKSGGCTIVEEQKKLFRELYPRVNCQDNFFTVSGNILTCAGGMSALDMALYMISEDYNLALAEQVSDQFLQDRMRSLEETSRHSRYLRLRMKSATLAAVVEIMDQHIENIISIEEIAKRAGSSLRKLEYTFKAHENLTPNQYYQYLRLRHARKMIEESQLPLNNIALSTGFQSHSYFSKRFKEKYGCTPTKLRKKVQLGDSSL